MPQEEAHFLEGRILGRGTYRVNALHPHWFENEAPLSYYRLHVSSSEWPFRVPEVDEAEANKVNAIGEDELPLEQFPLVEDFEVILQSVVLYPMENEKVQTYTVKFRSPSLGYLASPDSWEHTVQRLSQDGFEIPRGSLQRPYFELDQAWAFLIAEHDGFVYMLRGIYEEVLEHGYRTWFKVEKSRYDDQWAKAIQLSRDYYCFSS